MTAASTPAVGRHRALKATDHDGVPRFAVLQAAAAYGMSYLFVSSGGGYRMLFVLGAIAIVLALAVDLIAAPSGGQGTAKGNATPPSPCRLKPGL